MNKARDIYFFDTITSETVKNLIDGVIRYVDEDPNELITLYVSSAGGKYYAAQIFFEWVRLKQVSLQTFALSSVNSAAILLYAAGTKRLASELADFYFHEMKRTFANQELDFRQLVEESEDLSFLENKGLQLIGGACGCTTDKLASLCQTSTRLTAYQAKELGLVHEVVPLKP